MFSKICTYLCTQFSKNDHLPYRYIENKAEGQSYWLQSQKHQQGGLEYQALYKIEPEGYSSRAVCTKHLENRRTAYKADKSWSVSCFLSTTFEKLVRVFFTEIFHHSWSFHILKEVVMSRHVMQKRRLRLKVRLITMFGRGSFLERRLYTEVLYW